mgnify:CR=1 FL=1|jgi:hypothetical protein
MIFLDILCTLFGHVSGYTTLESGIVRESGCIRCRNVWYLHYNVQGLRRMKGVDWSGIVDSKRDFMNLEKAPRDKTSVILMTNEGEIVCSPRKEKETTDA